MWRQFFLYSLLSISFLSLNVNALPPTNIVTLDNVTTVEEAVADISSILELQDFEILLTLDHSANAARAGLDLAPTTVIFARLPAYAEQRVLKKSSTVAIDLPIKFLVFESEGEIRLATNSTGYLLDRHSLQTKDGILNIIGKLQNQFNEADDGLITIPSNQSVADTAAAIEAALLSTGSFGVPLVIDFSKKESAKIDWYKRYKAPILIVFGNPSVGTPLIQAQQSVGIDLPQKFLIWEDRLGNVNISYNDPFAIAARHKIEGQDERLNAVANALSNFANIGVGE